MEKLTLGGKIAKIAQAIIDGTVDADYDNLSLIQDWGELLDNPTIDTAPELLEALESLLDSVDTAACAEAYLDPSCPSWSLARAAIRKAKGEG